MANYNVDIAVALKGAKKLTAFNKDVRTTQLQVEGLNKTLKNVAKDQGLLVKSFDNLNQVLSQAKKNFNAVASGTSLQEKAARQLVLAEKQLNKEYQQRERLLNNLRTSYTPMPLPGSGVGSDPIAKSIARRQRKLSRGANQYSGPIGPGEAVSANLRSPLPPRSDVFLSSPLPPRVPLPPRSSIEPGQSLFGQSVTPKGGASGRSRQILQEEQALQEALARMDQRDMKLTGQSVNIEGRLQQALATQTANRKRAEEEVSRIRENAVKKIETREKKLILLRKKALKQEFAERRKLLRQNQFGNVNPGMGGFRAFSQRADEITANAAATANRPGIGSLIRNQFAPGGSFAATRGQRFRGAASNALIGGGFPLLFGQGAIGAAGGGIGGALGGALGGGFGFGLSIAGTAIAQQIQQTLDFRKSIRELNKEMQQMGISSNISGSQVRQLGKSLGITKEEAVKALQEFKRFGNQAVLFAEKFGGDFGKFDAIAQANTVQSALAAIRKINKDLTLDDELRFINSVRRQGVEATINQILDEMLEKEKKLKTEGFGQGEGKNVGANRKRLGQLKQESKATQDLIDKNTVFRKQLTKVRDQFIQNRDAAEAANRSIAKGLEDVNAELRKLNDVQFQVVELSKTLGSAFSESFKGIIKGTMSVGDAFRNMFMRIADSYLNMVAQTMSKQLEKGFLSLIGNFLPSLGLSITGGASRTTASGTNIGKIGNMPTKPEGMRSVGVGATANDLQRHIVVPLNPSTSNVRGSGMSGRRASGGSVIGGGSYLVGERGPEMFSPGVSGNITPNHELGGSTSIVVNVDASGSSVQSDGDGQQFGEALATAIQLEIIKQKRSGGLLS